MKDKKSFLIYKDKRDAVARLTPEERGELFLALFDYAISGVEPELKGAVRVIFPVFAQAIDEDTQKWMETCRRNGEAGAKGGRKTQALASARKRAEALASTMQANQADTETDTETDTESEKRNDSSSDKAPSRIDVREYAAARNSCVDPDKFFDYYEAGDWMDARGKPVRSWKQLFIAWEKRDECESGGTRNGNSDAEQNTQQSGGAKWVLPGIETFE